MRKLILAALAVAALFCPRPASAQMQVTPYRNSTVDGALATITTDTVASDISGTNFATVRFLVRSAGTATATAQVSIDGGTNWLASPYAKRLSAVSANPTIQAISATTLVTGDVWEVALPANATQFRLQCAATGTTTTVSVYGGLAYTPGVPVVAVLYDQTEGGIGAGLATGTVDFSGWTSAHIVMVTPTTQVWTLQGVDDTGTAVGPVIATTAASSGSLVLSQNVGASGATLAAGIPASWPFGERRFKITLPAGGTVSTGRARIIGRR